MGEIVIKAEHLSKYYHLGVINNGTLFRDIQTWWALKRGKQDPHSQIGSHKYDTSKKGFWALSDLNFEIKKGDRVGIIGKNGAGKSTLLKVLSRITAPTTGNVKIRGRVASLLEVGSGFHGELTGRENIYLNGAILGMKRREVDRKIEEIIAFSGIEKHIDTPVKRYSSGMYVRLGFAVAAHLDSEILIADEVLAVGDAEFQKKALGKMNSLSTSEGRTVLFVSHNMAQVKSLCTKGIILDHGTLKFQGSIEESQVIYNTNGIGNNDDIISQISPHSKTFHITNISINNEKNKRITIPQNSKSIKINIQGNSEKNQHFDLMVIFKNPDLVPISTFSIGHYEGSSTLIPAGDFDLSFEILLPEYLGQGLCIASICIHDPGIEGLVDFDNAIEFTFEGNHGKNGRSLNINGSGFMGLNGKMLL